MIRKENRGGLPLIRVQGYILLPKVEGDRHIVYRADKIDAQVRDDIVAKGGTVGTFEVVEKRHTEIYFVVAYEALIVDKQLKEE